MFISFMNGNDLVIFWIMVLVDVIVILCFGIFVCMVFISVVLLMLLIWVFLWISICFLVFLMVCCVIVVVVILINFIFGIVFFSCFSRFREI